ncbi:MAG: hypothetical protein JWO45_1106 [Spartobacteria bacterium]|nr:hypothetical protein [Spartobacteria bacterium]
MTYTAPQGDGQISRVHSMALRQEIGERLRSGLDRDLTEMPLRLLLLIKRLRDEPLQFDGT